MKTTNTKYICDVCGAEIVPGPDFILPIEACGYKYWIQVKRQDQSKCKGFYEPPFKRVHICMECIVEMINLINYRKSKEVKDGE